jgi:mannitol/fructose-specific phosphotransferase system IIA component
MSEAHRPGSPAPLRIHAVDLAVTASSRWDALARLGASLERHGIAHAGYSDSLLARERRSSTYLGHGVAVPHALHVHDYLLVNEGLLFSRFAAPLRWDDEEVSICIGIAASAAEQVEILCRLTATLLNSENLDTLRTSDDPAEIERVLQTT